MSTIKDEEALYQNLKNLSIIRCIVSYRKHASLHPPLAHVQRRDLDRRGYLGVGEAELFGPSQQGDGQLRGGEGFQQRVHVCDVLQWKTN